LERFFFSSPKLLFIAFEILSGMIIRQAGTLCKKYD